MAKDSRAGKALGGLGSDLSLFPQGPSEGPVASVCGRTCLPSSGGEGRVGVGSHQASCEPVFLAAGPASLDSLSRQ